MNKPVTVIISDLHLGGGPSDPGDDHVYQGDHLIKMLDELGASDSGKLGQIELFINGDLFELAQVKPELYAGGDLSRFWSSEQESCDRLKIILGGHSRIFEALKRFQDSGNTITMAAGNHDVDLYWDQVQKLIKAVVGPVQFELGKIWNSRYNGRLMISHGHMDDPVNSFKWWDDPILVADPITPGLDVNRLEMCPGTLFMLKIVNVLEEDYRFIDNIKPVTAVGRLLWRESKGKYAAVAWLLTKFAASHPGVTLETSEQNQSDFYGRLKDGAYKGSPLFKRIKEVAEDVYNKTIDDEFLCNLFDTEDSLHKFMIDALTLSGREILSPLERLEKLVPESSTLAIVEAGGMDERLNLREAAKLYATGCNTCEVIVTGHTHQPDTDVFNFGDRITRYYNPGSWTRYEDISKHESLTLDMLRDESKFPYQLNYVWVEEHADGSLNSRMVTFREQESTVGN